MSHNLFCCSMLSCARIWAFLEQIDAAEAARCRSERCPRCGDRLHSARYPRKPHALAPALRDDVRRFNFCCDGCRCRTTPPSVRFFGRRFRVAPVFLAASLLVLTGSAPVATISRMSDIPEITLRRWRRWWRETFPATAAWRWKRGELAVPPDEPPLVVLVRSMRGRSPRSRLLRSLAWLMPWTGHCGIGDGRVHSATASLCRQSVSGGTLDGRRYRNGAHLKPRTDRGNAASAAGSISIRRRGSCRCGRRCSASASRARQSGKGPRPGSCSPST